MIIARRKKRAEAKLNRRVRNWTAYVLKLEQGKYYVGITSYRDVSRRLEVHKSGVGGSKWTVIYKPIQILETKQLGRMSESEATKFENNLALETQSKYGAGNVYGGCLS